MPLVVLTDPARRDLYRLLDYLSTANVTAAAAALHAIRTDIQLLAEFPGLGQRVEDRPGVREWKVKFRRQAYLIRYRSNPDILVVLRIRHSREDA